jgi:hypothetical protein
MKIEQLTRALSNATGNKITHFSDSFSDQVMPEGGYGLKKDGVPTILFITKATLSKITLESFEGEELINKIISEL